MPALTTSYGESCTQALPCDLATVPDLCEAAREVLAQAGLPDAEVDAWELALTEAANNAIKYCRPEAADRSIRVDFLVSREWIEVRVTDHTPGFDWPERAELPPDDSETGRGVFLIQNLTDESYYLRGRGENCLVLRKRRGPATGASLRPRPSAAEELQDVRHTLDLMTEELASSFESLSAIFRFTAELQGGVDSEEFIPRWLGELLTITDSDWFVLRLMDDASRHLRVVAASSEDWRRVSASLDAALAEPGFIEARAVSRRSDAWFDSAMPLAPNDPLAGLAQGGCGFAHPLFASDSPVGVLSIGRRGSQRPFQAGQVSVIQTLGDFLALQIRSTQLHEEQVRARVNTRDLEIAANLQRTLLPEQLPSVPRAFLSGYYRSAREIGGDYYDAFPAGDGSILLVVADVMGKGLPAALFAFMFRSLVRSRLDLAARPGDFLAWLNQHLFQELERAEMFITAQIAFLDSPHDEIRVAGAGHPPLLIANVTGEVTEVYAGGPPLGIHAAATFPEERHPCLGCRALMYTDGVIEARNLKGHLLGLESIKAELASAARHGESSEAAKRRLVSLLETFAQGASPADDTAFIVVAGLEAIEHV